MAAILNSTILDSAILVFPLNLTHTCQDWFPPFAQKKIYSFILTQLNDDSHLEFCHVGFRHLVFFSQIHSKTLSALWLWLKLIQSDSNSFILTQLDDGSHLEFCHVGFSHLSFPLKLTHTCQDWFPPFAQKKPSLIHSDSTWWLQPSWNLPSWIQPFCTKLWLKLIQSDSNSFILTELDDGSHLEFHHLGFSHLSFSSQTHSHLPRLVPTICTKKTSLIHWFPPFAQKKLHSFILT